MKLPRPPAPEDVPVKKIDRDPDQPRKHFDKAKLAELADSIKTNGMVHPVAVRRVGPRYMLIFGERRWRAAQLAGAEEIPARVYPESTTPGEVLVLQLVENLQRVDLHWLERARTYQRMHAPAPEGLGMTAEAIADQVGLSRASVFATIKLATQLGPDALKAAERDEIDAAKASLLLKYEGENLQRRALELITRRDKNGDLPSFRAAQAILKRLTPDREPSRTSTAVRLREARAAEAEARRLAADRGLRGVVESLERKPTLDAPELRTMALAMLGDLGEDVARRRGVDVEHLQRQVSRMGGAQLRGLVFELAVSPWLGDAGAGWSDEWKALAKGFALNLRELEAGAREEAERAEKTDAAEALFKRGGAA